ncbi:MAG TPA: hypothetical protein VFK37_04885 [Bacillales bacterium]|nr:hypothetical protein [Bacillales bacterium]
MGSSNEEFLKEFSNAVTYGKLDKLAARAEQYTHKSHVKQTLDALQNKTNEMFPE